jgi:hypothetical protein
MTDPLVQAVSWALVNLVWQGVLVASALGLALRILPGRRAVSATARANRPALTPAWQVQGDSTSSRTSGRSVSAMSR